MRGGAQTPILDHEVISCAEIPGGGRSQEPDSLVSPPYCTRILASNVSLCFNTRKINYSLALTFQPECYI